MIQLRVNTPSTWAPIALSDFDAFLIDHAACERKASSVGMSFVVRYPDRPEIIEPMILFAKEELDHFHQVVRILQRRSVTLREDYPDPYVNHLLSHVRTGRETRLLDRLLTSCLIEARGHERLGLVTEQLKDPDLQTVYDRLTRAEEQHEELFLRIAYKIFPEKLVNPRLDELLEVEATAISAAPFRNALH